MKKTLLASAISLIMAGLGCGAAQATTYNYVSGTPFNYNQGAGQEILRGQLLYMSVTFDDVVSSGFTGAFGSADVVGWSLTVGQWSFSNNSSGFDILEAEFVFDNGNMTSPSFLIIGGGYWWGGYPIYNIGAHAAGGYDQACIGATYYNCMLAIGPSGVWTADGASPAPEPTSLAILGTGLLGYGLTQRRRA